MELYRTYPGTNYLKFSTWRCVCAPWSSALEAVGWTGLSASWSLVFEVPRDSVVMSIRLVHSPELDFDEDFDAMWEEFENDDEADQKKKSGASKKRGDTESYDGPSPRTIDQLKVARHHVEQGKVFDDKWAAQLAILEEAELNNKMVEAGQKRNADNDLAGNTSNKLAYICKHPKCQYYRKAILQRKTGEFKVTDAKKHTCQGPFIRTATQGSTNYKAGHLKRIITGAIEGCVEQKQGGV